jgi:uncharacterized protein (TIGR02145 family)
VTLLSNISFEDTFVDADGNVLVYDSSNISPKTGAVFDHESTSYDYITLGSQQWMTSNYGPTTYTDGTTIPQINDAATWAILTTGAWRWVDPSEQSRGKLYNYFAIEGIHDNDPNTPNKQFIPNGWRLPTHQDFNTTLHTYLDSYGKVGNGNSYAQAVGFNDHWQSVSSCSGGCPGYSMHVNPDGSNEALNSTGLGIMPNGWINSNGNTNYLNERSYLWTPEQDTNNDIRTVYYKYNTSGIDNSYHSKKSGLGIRLIRDYSSDINTDIGSVTNGSSPIYDNTTSYSYSQSLYPVSVLGDLKSINKITWFADTNINLNQTNDQWEIYLAETDSNSLESGSWISPSEFTKVFHGDVRFSNQNFGQGSNEHKQLVVELETPFIRDPSKNLVIAVRDNEGGAQASTKDFELRNLGDLVNNKTLVLGSNSPIDLNTVSGTTQSFLSIDVPWVILEGVTDSGIIYSSSTESNDAGILEPGETETYTATYTISQAAFDSGGVSNSLTVSLQNPAWRYNF